MSTATISVSPDLERVDDSALALTDLSGITGFLSVKGANAFTPIATLPPAAIVKFVIPDMSPGDYDFYAVETDNQKAPLSSAVPDKFSSFNIPTPVVVLAAPKAPIVGDITIT